MAAWLAAAWCLAAGPAAAAPQGPGDAGRVVAPQAPGDARHPPAPEASAPSGQRALRLTLEDAIARGLEASHRLGEIRAREAAAKAALDFQKAERLPLAGVQAGYQRTAHVDEYAIPAPAGPPRVIYPDVPDNLRTRIDLQWLFFTSGRVAAQARAAKAEAEAVGQDLLAARTDVKLEIARAFWNLVTAREAERVVTQALANMDAHLRDVKNRRDAGLVPPNDVLSSEAQRSRQQVLLIQARHAVESAAAEIGRLLGLDPDTPIEPEALLDQPLPQPPLPASALVGEARRSRSDRQAIESRLVSLEARGDAVRANRGPVIGLSGGFDYARPNPRIFPREAAWRTFWDVGVNVTWTFWDGGRLAAGLAQAAANRTALEERLKEFDSVLEVDVRQRLRDLDAARAAVAAASDGVRAATEARRVVEDRFKAGVAINTDVLDAQQVLLQAELDRTRALADVRLAEARLERTLGR